MKRFDFKLKGNDFSINIKECRNFFQKGSGLMFRRHSPSLLFIFNKPVSESIHSFFCLPFVCIWFNQGKVVETRYVEPWNIFIKPEKKFDKFLEIPINDKNFSKIKSLLKN